MGIILLSYFWIVLGRLETLQGSHHNEASFILVPYSMSSEGGAQGGQSCIQVIPEHHLHTKVSCISLQHREFYGFWFNLVVVHPSLSLSELFQSIPPLLCVGHFPSDCCSSRGVCWTLKADDGGKERL